MSGRLLLPLMVSIAEIIKGLNMSMVSLDKFSESLLGTSLLLLLSDKIESFSRAMLMSLGVRKYLNTRKVKVLAVAFSSTQFYYASMIWMFAEKR